jgi:hypothetical protein
MMQKTDLITIETALKAMSLYWGKVYERSLEPGDIGVGLGDLSLLPDGGTADPAAFQDFIDCVEIVLIDPDDPRLFLHLYTSRPAR